MNNWIVAPVFLAALMATLSSAGPVKGKKVVLTEGSKTFYTIQGADSVSWEEAIKLCKSVNLKTAVVSNKYDNESLKAVARKLADQGKQNYLWLGATLRKGDGKWVWKHNGQELTFSDWRHDAVLDDPGSSTTSGYNCGFMNGYGGWGTWACGAEVARVVCQDL